MNKIRIRQRVVDGKTYYTVTPFVGWGVDFLCSVDAILYANTVCGATWYTRYNFHTPFIGDYKHVD